MSQVLPLDRLAKDLKDSEFYFEAIKDSSGVHGVSISVFSSGSLEHYFILNNRKDEFDSFLKNIFDSSKWRICWDSRNINDLKLRFNRFCNIIDLSFFYPQNSLMRAAGSNLSDSEISEFQNTRRNFGSHIKACKIAKVDLENNSLIDIIPNSLLLSYYRLRNEMLHELFNKISDDKIADYSINKYNRIKTFYDIENNGIHIDRDFIFNSKDVLPGDRRFISDVDRRIKESNSNFVYTKFNLKNTTKTGRIHPEKHSFNCMGIPKSFVRKAITSRWSGGKIASLDLNAADYRIIVATIDDPFINGLYKDQDDFHAATTEYIFGNRNELKLRRKVIKDITYTAIYGGSLNKLSAQTGLSEEKVKIVLKKLDKIISPIEEFKDSIYNKSIEQGYIEDIIGERILLSGNEHKGKVFALYIQKCCSLAFLDGVVAVHNSLIGNKNKSKILFTVHDEIVSDIHPQEIHLIKEIQNTMELGTSRIFGVKLKAVTKIGNNYWDLKND